VIKTKGKEMGNKRKRDGTRGGERYGEEVKGRGGKCEQKEVGDKDEGKGK
jgi:hypothetical protein